MQGPMKPIQLSQDQKDALLDQSNLPDKIRVRGTDYFPKRTVKAGFKGVVWQVIDEHGRSRAAKLAIYQDYEDRSFLRELNLAAKLEPYPEFAKFIDADCVTIEGAGLGSQIFVCFIEEWINGYTLDEFLNQHQESITCSFLAAYVDEMCSALNALRAVKLRHDDLHSGNVMLALPADGMFSDRLRVKIVDTGSLKSLEIPTKKNKDDHRHFVEQLIAIYNVIHSKKLFSARDRFFLGECKKLFQSMLDDDPSTALVSPDQIKSQFAFASARASSSTKTGPPLQSPFEYISAEHIADDKLLVEMFASSCPWLEKVEGPDPCLVTGPRGCGKSTIFRWLSLKAHLHKATVDPQQFRIAGFYISCSTDLQNRLSWISTEALAEKFRKEIIHYFNLLLAREIFQTLGQIAQRTDRETLWGFGKPQEEALYDFLRQSLHTSHSVIQGTTRINQGIDMLENEMYRCHVQMLKGLNLGWTTPETFLGDLTTLMTKQITFFSNLRIAFLIDDFSSHRLPESVQIILNRIIWERRDTHIFKLSSEKYGAVLTDSHDATSDVTREMLEIDCGREYLSLGDSNQVAKARKFSRELLANRLLAAGYKGTPEELLGESKWEENSLAKALRTRKQDEQGRKDDQYHGLECIADLCSGDISTLLFVYRRIFERGGIKKSSKVPVLKYLQHQAIESVSRELLEAIQHHHPYGKEMYEIVKCFGNLTKRILKEGRLIQGGIIPQCPRIEVDQDYSAQEEFLAPAQQKLARELVRRAAFIEMEPGRSRHRSVTTLRWQLRRVFLPAFGAALSKNDAIKWRPSQFKYFLTDPKSACDAEWQKRPKEENLPSKEKNGQPNLFPPT
jgi:hypothetical protein